MSVPIRNHRRAAILLVVLVAVVVLVYSPGLNGPFLFDDFPNVVNNPLISVEKLDAEHLRDAAFSIGNRPYPHRGLARVSFALNYYFAGLSFDAFAFKLTNLIIHVLNGLLIYWLSVLLVRRYVSAARGPSEQAGWNAMQSHLPLVVAALWMLHPIQLTSVLYVVQRMTSMSAFFVFLGLLVFVTGRMRLESGSRYGWTLMFSGLGAGVVLGYLCKQNAVLLPFLAFLVELYFFRFQTLAPLSRRRLYGFYALTVGIPAVAALAGLTIGWESVLEGYLDRDFTPWERLLTQSRVLFFYLGLLFFPHIRAFGLYHDDIALSTGLFEPWTTFVAMAAWIVLVALALWGVRRRAIWSFGLLWYLVGHSLESSLLSLELVFEHRNYVPSYGVLFAAAYYLLWGLARVSRSRNLTYPVVGLLVLVFAFTTFTRAGIWSDKITWNLFTAKNHPESYRSLTGAGVLDIIRRSDARDIYASFGRAARARESTIIPLVEMHKLATGMRNLVEAGEQPGAEALEETSDAELLERPLVLSAPYLRRVESTLDAEIRRRLEEYPVGDESSHALDRLRKCIVKGVDVCVPLLEKLEDWYELALANDRMTSSIRGKLQMGLAHVHWILGESELAVAGMKAAIATDPHNLSYPTNLASLQMQLGAWDEVAEILEALESNRPWSGFGSRYVRWIRSRYEDHLQTSSGGSN